MSPHRWVPPAQSWSSLTLPERTQHSNPGPSAVLTGSDRVVRHRRGVAHSLPNTRRFPTPVLAAQAATPLPWPAGLRPFLPGSAPEGAQGPGVSSF